MTTIPCLRCGNGYERKGRGRRSHYCGACRVIINREKSGERYRQMEALKAEIRIDPDVWIESGALDRIYHAPIYVQIDDYLESLEFDEMPIIRDRMPDGWASNTGPDEGVTTEYEDLAEILEANRREAARDPWWSANPHWNVGL